MEPASEFDLNRSLQIWREQLAAQPGLTPEARQELESHLGETMADLRQRGIIAEEAFWLARCRVGPPERLAQEFAKANPWPLWRKWALWMATSILGMWIIQGTLVGVSGLLTLIQLKTYTDLPVVVFKVSPNRPHVLSRYADQTVPKMAPFWLQGIRDALWNDSVGDVLGALIVICVTAWIACQPERISTRLWRLVFGSKGRFLLIGALSIFAVFLAESWSETVTKEWLKTRPDDWIAYFNGWSESNFKLMGPSALVLLITGLIPSGKRQIRQTSSVSPASV